MKLKLLAGLLAAFFAFAIMPNAYAARYTGCEDMKDCVSKKKVVKKYRASKAKSYRTKSYRSAKVYKARKYKAVRHASRYKHSRRHHVRSANVKLRGNRGHVVAMIKSQAPRYGVPTWFALRIANVESGYNPRARGAAGELGVFQMKCQTARGLGFRGGCGQLLNASTNIHYGLRHLQLAVRSSRGNLRLAASKHNGGLGRKSLVRGYVSRVF
jgi:soluble lytic murein transglycosylase-like protein